jgi:hypothetical protein
MDDPVKPMLLAALLAYVMPAYSVLRRVAVGRDELSVSGVRAEGQATVSPALARDLASALGTGWTSGELSLAAVWSVRFPGRCRLDLQAVDSTRSLSAVWANGKRRAEGPDLPAAAVAVEQLCATLALRSQADGESRAALEHHLAGLKVDTRLVTLGRFEGSVAYVLGERSDVAAQFWVYKERFLPARVRVPDPQGAWDVRFIDYTSQATGEWLPRVVEVYRGGELQLRLTVLSADGKAALDGVKF